MPGEALDLTGIRQEQVVYTSGLLLLIIMAAAPRQLAPQITPLYSLTYSEHMREERPLAMAWDTSSGE
jgi:hypothetical protein